MLGKDLNPKKLHTINRRMFIIGAAKLLIFTGIITRLFSLQITENKKYLTLSDKNRLREWRLPPIRGEFVDYFGNVVAGNLKVYQLHVIPEQVEDFKYLMVRLKTILNLNNIQFERIIKQKNKQKKWEAIVVSENLTWEQFTTLNYFLHDLTGAKPVLSISRDYPFKENYTHVLGYVSEASEEDILNNEKIGLIGSKKCMFYNYDKLAVHNQNHLLYLMKKFNMNVSYHRMIQFTGGTVFWIRFSILKDITFFQDQNLVFFLCIFHGY